MHRVAGEGRDDAGGIGTPWVIEEVISACLSTWQQSPPRCLTQLSHALLRSSEARNILASRLLISGLGQLQY